MVNQEKPLYIFLHIPKTGGTTFRDHIEANFKEGEYSMLRTRKSVFSQEEVFNYYNKLTESQKEKIIFIGGHFVYYGIHKFFPGRDCRYITFLREPVDRLISHFNHCFYLYLQGRRSPWTENFFEGKSKSFSSWLLHNQNEKTCFAFLARRLLNKNTEERFTQNDLNSIKDILKSFYFIGILENKHDFDILYKLIKVTKKIPNKNISRDFIDYSDKNYLSPSKDYDKVKKIISNKCNEDLEIYELGLELNRRYKMNL